MAEKSYKYTAKFKEPQTVAGVELEPQGGSLTERELKNLKKDPYGASLLDSGLLVVDVDSTAASQDTSADENSGSETIPDFDAATEEGSEQE